MSGERVPPDAREAIRPVAPPATAILRRLIPVLRAAIVLALPPFLVLTSVRLVMSELFLKLEYNRPGFPADRYGFTQADRLRYAPHAVRYLLDNEPISYLAELEIDGEPMFTAKELQHMEDVQRVTRSAFRVHLAVSATLAASVLALVWRPATRRALRQGLFEGGILTVLLMLAAVVIVLANWDFFFTGFHRLFFEGDSWLFSTRSTLIRLFPERFWFDAAITIGGLTLAGSGAAILASRIGQREVG